MRGNIKYFYKQNQTLIFTDGESSDLLSNQHKRYNIIEDRAAGIFTVTMRRLKQSDAGAYWCGVGTGANTGSVSLITEVILHVVGK